jgi:Tol biopolymer transport system component
MNADGTNQVRLTNDSVANGFPDWAPDGSEIAFDPGRMMNADSTNQRTIWAGRRPSWHPESTELAGLLNVGSASNGPRWDDIITATRGGGFIADITHTNGFVASWEAPAWSPNGGQIVAQRSGCPTNAPSCTPDWRIVVMKADSSHQTEIAAGTSPDWQSTPQPR